MKKNDWKQMILPAQMPFTDLYGWLNDKGSFMRRLKRHGVLEARVRVVKQEWQCPFREESFLLNIPARRYAWVREIIIESSAGQWMYARGVFPMATLTGNERQLLHLKNRPLGSVLFKNPHLTRSDFEFACLQSGSFWVQKVRQYISKPADELWARRSVFQVKRKPLLLTEIFFPGIAALNNAT